MGDEAQMEKSGNEIEMLVLKAARGGGVPFGHAEDLAAAARYLDLDALGACPCSGGAVMAVPQAIDLVEAGEGAQTIRGDTALIAAYVAAAEARTGQHLVWDTTDTGAVLHRFDGVVTPAKPLGRRALPAALGAHLHEEAAKLLVPETEASRAAGAGAGLTDND